MKKSDRIFLTTFGLLIFGDNIYSYIRYNHLHYAYAQGDFFSVLEMIFAMALVLVVAFGRRSQSPK